MAGMRFAAGPGAAAHAPVGRDGSSDVRALLDDLGIGQYADALDVRPPHADRAPRSPNETAARVHRRRATTTSTLSCRPRPRASARSAQTWA